LIEEPKILPGDPQVDTKNKYRNNIGAKFNSLTQQFICVSTTVDTWATCFDSI